MHVAGIVFFFFYSAFLKSVSKKCGLRRKSIAWLFPTHLRNQEHKSRGCSTKFVSISSYFTKIKSTWKLNTSISPPAAEAAFAVCSQSHTSPWGFCETNRGSWNQQNKRCCWSFIRSLHSIRKQINNRRKYWEVWVPTYQLFLLKRKGKRAQQTSCSRSCHTQWELVKVRQEIQRFFFSFSKEFTYNFWNYADMQSWENKSQMMSMYLFWTCTRITRCSCNR